MSRKKRIFVLAGRAIFYSEGVPARVCGADDVIHHYSNQHHRIQMQPGPLTGDGYMGRSKP